MMALNAMSNRVLHAQAELNTPLQSLTSVNRTAGLSQMVGEGHAMLLVGSNKVHQHEEPPVELVDPTRGDDERMLIEAHPQEGFPFECISGTTIRQQFTTDCFQSTHLSCLTVVH